MTKTNNVSLPSLTLPVHLVHALSFLWTSSCSFTFVALYVLFWFFYVLCCVYLFSLSGLCPWITFFWFLLQSCFPWLQFNIRGSNKHWSKIQVLGKWNFNGPSEKNVGFLLTAFHFLLVNLSFMMQKNFCHFWK